MNFYFSHSSDYDYEKELYAPIKASILATNHRFFLPHEPENIDIDVVDELKYTDIADLLAKLQTQLDLSRAA